MWFLCLDILVNTLVVFAGCADLLRGPYWLIGAGASKMLMVMVKMLLVKMLMVMVMAKMLIISCICWVCRSLGGPYWPIGAGEASHGNYLKAYSHITH